jgi:hypothetical protein
VSRADYVANFTCGSRVLLIEKAHPRSGQQGIIIRILPNPSGRPENQWYDVRFADFSIGRFLEKYLVPIPAESVAS